MSREKKSKTGINGDLVFARKHNRTSGELEGRLRKKAKKRKGLQTGSRHSEGSEVAERKAAQQRDPRLGSKKQIPLIVDAPKKLNKQERRISAEKELAMLENDAQLNVLLDRIDNGEKLGAGLQKYVDEKLDRIEVLMNQLGLFEDAEEPEEEETIAPQPQAKSAKAKAKTDDDLLSQFENLDLNDYKG
ncbi:Der GTPase-activating protein YihI [Vibrio fluvialis]|uniref:Der GTPase-activating protein YihI n=1 Tax=Vibrio fluvialis TaxID=676 RepID=UPI00155889BC|nr:Der GTPase-activating protein YihI [Vibrio fluvialis]MBY7907440.1 GTPase-activating protein [Vibrio fluvialis]MBY8177248.1 GTPase-activating protein [Vibrio fluvialis]MBY8198227.1 GTPase-activating protein [Vibrio fluvialis]MBY8309160.1 GTPase-activating protein [Vibrio fluvialis]MCE7650170.1 GTPase-activating protein [Vibrio fluvialis]